MEVFVKKVELIKIYLAVGMCVFGAILISAGFLAAPLGVIDNSVLVAFGEIITFAGAILGINYLYSAKHKELETRFTQKIEEIKNKDEV